jgi:hypothetical protein
VKRLTVVPLAAVVLLVVSLAGTGCTATTPIACWALDPPVLGVDSPDGGHLDESSSGTYCATPGQRIEILLHPPTPAKVWGEVVASRPDLLKPFIPEDALTEVPPGVTVDIFDTNGLGTAQLSSTRSDGASWSVTIVIRWPEPSPSPSTPTTSPPPQPTWPPDPPEVP